MPTDFSAMENLIELNDHSEAAITQVIHERFKKNKIYTKASDVLIAINNFSKDPNTLKEPSKDANIHRVSRNALTRISEKSTNHETIAFGGESGSGKSFQAFQVLEYLTSQRNSTIRLEQIKAIKAVLQSFGCAKTLKNDVSTRYGCSFDLLYKDAKLSGLNIKHTVPLEVSRVVSQKPGERNFNIFYEICHGLNTDAKNSFGIRELQKFFYLNQGNSADNIHIDEDRFDDVDNALDTLGFSEDHRLSIYKIVSTILHIGNIYFKTKRDPNVEGEIVDIGNASEVKWIAFLLEIDYEILVNALLQKSDDGISNITLNTALDNRDSLAMLLYEELFKWVLTRMSVHFKCPLNTGTISIIDHYGLEKFNNNGLEEFLINSVNERLENVFVKHTFHSQLVDYLKDGLNVEYKVPASIENGKVVELLFKKPYGLLPLLTDECKFPKGTNETYLDHCNLNHIDKSSYGKARNKDREEFGVRHNSGTIWYSVNDFFRKNKRVVPGQTIKALCESRNSIISMLFKGLDAREGSDLFISQAQLIMKGVHEIVQKIDSSSSQFVRCIKSNNERQPAKFDIPMVNRQIKSLLLSELLQFRMKGYPIKIEKSFFARQYRCLLPGDIAMCQNEKEIILDILQGQGVKYENDYKIGSKFVFLRERLFDVYETQQTKICGDAAIVIQKNIKGYVARKQFENKKKAIIKLQAGVRGWKARRDYIVQREEMFKTLGRTTKRNKRLEAYHQALENIPNEVEPTTFVGYIDIDKDAKNIMSRPSSENSSDATYITNNYLSVPIKTFLSNMTSKNLEEYAEENFKGHLLEPRREPIMTPFLHKESEFDFRLSVEIFKLILTFMNNRKMTKPQRDDLGRYIVQQGISNPCQRDEILVQIVNQLNKNQDKVAVDLGWKLLHMAISVFPPTENLIPTLIGFFNQQGNPLKEQLFSTLHRRLKIYDSEISRELPPSKLEILATPAAHHTVAEVHCYDGLAYDVHVNPWMTANEVAERILKQRGVGVPIGWTVEVETPSRVYAPTGTHFIHDVFAEIDGVKIRDDQKVFFSFPPEKLVKPQPAAEPEVQQVAEPIREPTPKAPREFPTPAEWSRRPPVTPKPVERPPSRKAPSEDSDESIVREFNEEAEYAYTLPMKNKDRLVGKPIEEKIEESDIYPDYEPIIGPIQHSGQPRKNEITEEVHNGLISPTLPRKTYSRNGNEEYTPINFAPPPTFNYPTQMPMMQYVPVMMAQPMMPGQPMAMIPQPMMMSPHFSYTPQYPQVPQYVVPEPNVLSPQSVRSRGYEPINAQDDRMHSHGYSEQRRFRRGEIPSQYSTIRNMPVPEHHGDVDQFLDAVFNQVLSTDDHKAADISANQIAMSIKGGRNGPRPEGFIEQPREYYQGYPTMKRYTTAESPMRERARSLPRHVTSPYDNFGRRPHSRNSYSEESTSSDDQMDYQLRVPSRERSLPRFDVQNGNGSYQKQKGPVYMMMPVQVNENGEMILLSPVGTDNRSRSRLISDRHKKPARGVEKYIAKRSPSVDGYSMKPPMIRRTPDGIERIQMMAQSTVGRQPNRFEDFRTLPRSESRSRDRMEAPLMTRQIPPRVDYNHMNGKPPLNYRSPSPVPADRRGLNRLPVESYAEPVVKNTTTNGEQLYPHRFNLEHEKAVIRAEKDKSKEALNKLNSQLKKVPPPIDNVRLIRPNPPVQRSPSPIPPEPTIRTPSPLPQQTPQPVRENWVIHDAVDRDPNTQERVKGSLIKTPPLPVLQKNNHADKPAIKLVTSPWKLTIRKEMFYPGEMLNDIQIIDQVFAQIIGDCRKAYPYRIRLQDRKDVEHVLRKYKIPPSDLNNQSKISPDVKVEIIEKARLWPFYFNQIYEVIEKRPDESVGILFAISEHGIRLIIHTPHDIESPLKIHDHFPFETIVDVSLEANDLLAVHISHETDHDAYTSVRIKTNQAAQIKKTLETCIRGGAVQKRRLVRALEDYSTNEINHLSFKRGDVIELLPAPEGDIPPARDCLYGRIENRFGFLLSQYVDYNHSENVPPLKFENSDERDEHVKFFGDEIPFSSERFTMLDFATKYFRRPKLNKKQEDWTWGDITQAVKFTEKPISHSLIKDFENEEDKLAVETFTAVMQFMGDEPIKKSESITDAVFKILIICHRNPRLRDEVYCQLIKQITSNTSVKADSSIRGWRLLSIITAYFSSTLTLKPYLLQFLSENAEDVQRQFHGTAKNCLFNLHQTFKYGGRQVLLNAIEVQQTTDGLSLRRQPFFIARDHSVKSNLKMVTVAEEMIQELCKILNVRSLSEQQEFSLCYTVGKEKRMHYCKNDDYLMDIITEMEHKKLQFEFYLKRTVWIHPLRFDNNAYVDSMFDQVIDDYLRGTTVATNSHGQLTAVTREEVMKLGACLFLLLPDNGKGLTTKTLPQIVPKTVMESKSRRQEEMIQRINNEIRVLDRRYSPADLKQLFLELLSTWPLFGLYHFRVKSAVENGNQLPEVILTIGKSGVQLLQPKSQDVFKQWNYVQITSVESVKKPSFKLVRMVTNISGEENVLDCKTDEADEIAHLIGQYIHAITEKTERGSTEL